MIKKRGSFYVGPARVEADAYVSVSFVVLLESIEVLVVATVWYEWYR